MRLIIAGDALESSIANATKDDHKREVQRQYESCGSRRWYPNLDAAYEKIEELQNDEIEPNELEPITCVYGKHYHIVSSYRLPESAQAHLKEIDCD